MVRAVTEACAECRHRHSDRQSDDDPLFESRLKSSLRAFEKGGVDYGPFLTKQERGRTRA